MRLGAPINSSRFIGIYTIINDLQNGVNTFLVSFEYPTLWFPLNTPYKPNMNVLCALSDITFPSFP